MSYIPTLRDAALTASLHSESAPRNSDRILARRRRVLDVGVHGRILFSEQKLWRRAPQRRLERLYWHLLKPLCAVALILWYTPQYARAVQKKYGVPLGAQIAAQCQLGFDEWVNPRCYYFHEHYRRRGPIDIDGYVMRHEIKEGLLKSLHKLCPKVHGNRINLGHKLAFAEICAAFDLPTVPIVAHARRGRLMVTGPGIERDLFLKREHGRGAAGARPLLVSPDQPRDMTRRLRTIARASWRAPVIVQPLLQNHPFLLGLAVQSLLAIRVFTCLDAKGRPVVTHAMLRSIGKLEPDWPTQEEFAAPIDLATGVLGLMCGDRRFGPEDRTAYHPMTEALVLGRKVPMWPAVHALALKAHGVFCDRLLVGWDIAVTPEGPVLIEGNSYPDTEFLQRVHDQPIGDSPLGPLLAHHLDRLEALEGGDRDEF